MVFEFPASLEEVTAAVTNPFIVPQILSAFGTASASAAPGMIIQSPPPLNNIGPNPSVPNAQHDTP